MVAKEMKQQDFLFSQPATKIVSAESMDITTTSAGKCSIENTLYISFLFTFSLGNMMTLKSTIIVTLSKNKDAVEIYKVVVFSPC